MEHEPDPQQEHQTRADSPLHPASDGVSLHGKRAEKQKTPRQAGHRASQIQNGDFCSRLFLASPQKLQRNHHAKNPHRMVARKIRRQRPTGPEKSGTAQETGLEGVRDLGMPDKKRSPRGESRPDSIPNVATTGSLAGFFPR